MTLSEKAVKVFKSQDRRNKAVAERPNDPDHKWSVDECLSKVRIDPRLGNSMEFIRQWVDNE